MKIAFVLPFMYNWNSFPTTRASYEMLQILGHEVDLFNKNKQPKIDYNNYDQVWLIGAGTKLTTEEFVNINVLVIAFGLSDPNLFNSDHFINCDVYCTNDLEIYKSHKHYKKTIYNPTSCDKRYHKNLNLVKETDILTFGIGKHKFVTNRNETVNKLRSEGFNIKVFGRDWDKHKDTYAFIEGQELIEEINKAHLLLDLSNETTSWPHRILEAGACGTPVISINREDTKQMFGEETIIYYDDYEDLALTLNVMMNHKAVLKIIGCETQKICYEKHDISVRIKQLLDKLWLNMLYL